MARSLSRSMLNVVIFDPWQRSLFYRQRTPGKEPLPAGKTAVNDAGDQSFERVRLGSRGLAGWGGG